MPRKHKIVPEEERFEFLTDKELIEKRLKLKTKNTTKADKKADKIFANYLRRKRSYLPNIGCLMNQGWIEFYQNFGLKYEHLKDIDTKPQVLVH